MRNFLFKTIILSFLFLNQCFLFDPYPCNCSKEGDENAAKRIALYILHSAPIANRISTYSCNINEENLCYELQNYLARRSNGSFCKSFAGAYSENSCTPTNRIGSCFLEQTSNLRKIYYATIWNTTSAQTDCGNLKGTWVE